MTSSDDDSGSIRKLVPKDLITPMGYSHVALVRPGRKQLAFLAGQVPADATGAVIGVGNFRLQVEQVFANLQRAIEAAGGTFADIFKLNYFCVEKIPDDERRVVREIRDRYVDTKSPPVSTFVMISRLVHP